MRFVATPLNGAHVIYLERIADERGSFARSFCRREFAAHGLEAVVAQCNVSYNRVKGTVRGMHFQHPPAAEAKLVRCARGAIFDVAVDLRPASPTFCQWFGAELSEENGAMLYVPRGFAHGFQTLTDGAEIFYQMSEFYTPQAGGGVRWNDPAIRVEWPLPVTMINERDATYPDCDPAALEGLNAFLTQPQPA